MNCNIIFTIFPNVENLRTSSLIYKRYNYFAEYLQNNKSIIINNGYIPFIEKGIKSSTYSLTDMHSSCKGYELYAKWLLNLRKN